MSVEYVSVDDRPRHPSNQELALTADVAVGLAVLRDEDVEIPEAGRTVG
jgi:hypothetical protein